MNWAKQQRLAFIAKFSKKKGRINRSDIMQEFGISLPQASIDLQDYLKLNPDALRYNLKAKQYEATR